MKAKYVIVDSFGLEVPIIFDTTINHSSFKDAGFLITSAGFVLLEKNDVFCYGESTSLKLGSRGEEDSNIIKISLSRT